MKNAGLPLLWLDTHSNKRIQKILAAADEQQTAALNEKLHGISDCAAQTLCGALMIETVDNVEDILHIANGLDNFDYFPDVSTNRELGVYLVESGIMEFEEKAHPYLNYGRIGVEYHANHSGVFTDGGYVTRQHEEPLPRQDFTMQMG